jgi:quercetin dioxygenase-like cupin family protein
MMNPEQTNAPPEGPLEARALVDYQEGSIVSRTLVKNDGGSLTVLALDAGQAISTHTVPHEAFVLVLDGEGSFTVGAKEHRVATGHLLHLPATVPHAVAAPVRFKMLLSMLKGRA